MDWIVIAFCALVCCGCRNDVPRTFCFVGGSSEPVAEVSETTESQETETKEVTVSPEEVEEVVVVPEQETDASAEPNTEPEAEPEAETEEAEVEVKKGEEMVELPHFGTVYEAVTEDKLDELLSRADVTVIDFSGVWCGPCKMLAPEMVKMAEEFPSICFCSVDVDKCRAITDQAGNVLSLPCVVIYAQGKEVHRVIGCAPAKIRASINKIVNEQTSEK